MSKMTREVIPYLPGGRVNMMTKTRSLAVRVGGTMYISGQLGIISETLSVVPGGIVPETRLALTHLGKILERGRMNYKNVVKCTVYMADINEVAEMNKVFSEFFGEEPPAQVAFQVARLLLDARVAIEAIAVESSD
ncbi:2-iminobutanoate/2-iminopropanoate deaminase [Ixodes scapularis]